MTNVEHEANDVHYIIYPVQLYYRKPHVSAVSFYCLATLAFPADKWVVAMISGNARKRYWVQEKGWTQARQICNAEACAFIKRNPK